MYAYLARTKAFADQMVLFLRNAQNDAISRPLHYHLWPPFDFQYSTTPN